MPRATSFDRRLRDALLPALFAGAGGFVLTWLLLAPPAPARPQPATTLRVRLGNGVRSELAMDEAVARLLSAESLTKILAESGAPDRRIKSSAGLKMAERMRESVRVDIREADEAGVQEVRIRWVGEPREKMAGRLVKALSRQLAAGLAATDPTGPQHEYEAARSELIAAETALADARDKLEMALDAPGVTRADRRVPTPRQREANLERPPEELSNAVEADEAQLARQRLLELEQRREVLADRLTPEHPEMRALDEKIDELKSAIARRPQAAPPRRPPVPDRPTVAEVLTDVRAGEEADEKRIARSRQLWQAVIAAQDRYAAALGHERACRQSLALARGHGMAEIESTPETAPAVERQAAWRRWLLSALTAVLCDGLALALWPSRRRTFASAEEVRAVTRLPVVVIESASLN